MSVSADGTYTSPSVLATQVGKYTWSSSYSGDGDLNGPAADNGVGESVTTVSASPMIVTAASETASGVVGSSELSDTATLSGGYDLNSGSITFYLTAPGATTATEEGTVSVSADGTYTSPSVLATQVGTYTWSSSYSGDGDLNGPAADNGVGESVTTVSASPMIVTAASETASGVVGSSELSDTATLSGGYDLNSGSITFDLTAPGATTATEEGTVSVSADGTYTSPSVLATQVGTYTWSSSYSGDGDLNGPAADNGVGESVTTVSASPMIVTAASETASGVVGSSELSDTATLSGGYDLNSGSITFYLTAPGATTATEEGTVSVSADGTYTSPSVLATQVGTYTWSSSYSGDGDLNGPAADNGVGESVTTVSASPMIVTAASETASGVVEALS